MNPPKAIIVTFHKLYSYVALVAASGYVIATMICRGTLCGTFDLTILAQAVTIWVFGFPAIRLMLLIFLSYRLPWFIQKGRLTLLLSLPLLALLAYALCVRWWPL